MLIFAIILEIYNQQIKVKNKEISLFIKREDLLHPFVSGNKFRKLKYNMLQAKLENQQQVITFGGAFSNHIAATAYACKENNLQSIGIIRGEELEFKTKLNPTLQFAQECGMKFEFVSRENYREKSEIAYLENLQNKYGNHYLIPEGGANDLAVKGCEAILTNQDENFDYVCCAVGTGTTIAGLINSSTSKQKILGFPALKGDFLQNDIRKFATKTNWELITDYHFGGYGKVTPTLIEFMNQFYLDTNIPLDPVYTAKMVFGVLDLIDKNYFPKHSKILMIHTGGLQGIKGMNDYLASKKSIKIDYYE